MTNKDAERHFFITSLFQHGKSPYNIIIISFWRFPFSFHFYFFLWFCVCKTTFKGFLQNFIAKMFVSWAHSATFKIVGPPQFWIFFKTDPNFLYVIKWDANKNQYRSPFVHVWCSCKKLCNIFDAAFLFDLQHDKTNKMTSVPSEDSNQLFQNL